MTDNNLIKQMALYGFISEIKKNPTNAVKELQRKLLKKLRALYRRDNDSYLVVKDIFNAKYKMAWHNTFKDDDIDEGYFIAVGFSISIIYESMTEHLVGKKVYERAITSLHCADNRSDIDDYATERNGADLAYAFLELIDGKKENPLEKMKKRVDLRKKVLEQNRILEGKL